MFVVHSRGHLCQKLESAESIAIYCVREVRHQREVSELGEAWPAERGHIYMCAEGSFSIAT